MSVTFKSGVSVLDPEKHKRLLADAENICVLAGLQPKYLRESMKNLCGQTEQEWVVNFHKHKAEGTPGLLISGLPHPDARCQSICAALIRNFIDARIVPLNSLLDMVDKGFDAATPSVLLIPNLFVTLIGKSIPAWKIQMAYDILLNRSARSRPTVAYVESLKGMEGAYGAPFTNFMSTFKVAE